jgi:hypothetical protein
MKKTHTLNQFRLGNSAWVAIKGLLLAFCFSIAGCDKSIADSHYKVIDTGFWSAQVNSLTEPLWLDNDRIIFTSPDSLAAGKLPYHVKVLNTVTGKVDSTRFTAARCVREGVAVFEETDKATRKTVMYRGTPKNYREELPPPPDMFFDQNFECGWVPQKTAGQIGFDSYPARSKLRGENYREILEPRTKSSKGKAVYHARPNDPGREIPDHAIGYSEFLDAYVIATGSYQPANPQARSFWILERNGDIKEVPYPQTMLQGRVDVFPLKQGYLMQYNSGKASMTDSGNRGLYFIQSDKVQRLIVGTVHGVHVSQNGCKAAFVHARTVEEDISIHKPYRTVKIINFCQDRKPQ